MTEGIRSIKRLDDSVRSRLNSQVTISSFGAAVRELLQNSLDSGANEIDIKLDFQTLSIYMKDNGKGMTPDDLENVGKRYFTSKVALLNELEEVSTFGFRGEALHSLSLLSHLSITSKYRSSNFTFSLKNVGRMSKVRLYKTSDESPSIARDDYFQLEPISDSGTIVTATSIFANTPVRRGSILNMPEHKQIDEVKQAVLQTLFGNPDSKVSVFRVDHNLGSLRSLFLVGKHQEKGWQSKSASLIRLIYGPSILPDYENINASFQEYELLGITGLQPTHTKDFQYIFINGRSVGLSNEDNKSINRIFINANFGTKTQEVGYTENTNMSPAKRAKKYPITRLSARYPVFIINVRCPVIIDDLLQDPSKRLYLSKHWNIIFKMIRKVFMSFLSANNYDLALKSRDALDSPSPSPKRPKRETPSYTSPVKINQFTPGFYPNELIHGNRYQQKSNQEDSCNEANGETEQTGFEINEPASTDQIQVNKSDFRDGNYRIIKQIDKKFILIVMRISRCHELGAPALLVIDQHACDERIRVEALLKDFVDQVLDPNTQLKVELAEPITITIANNESILLEVYKDNLETLGIGFAATYKNIAITHLPQLLIDKFDQDFALLKSYLLQYLHDLDKKIKSPISKSFPFAWFQIVVHLPQVFIDVINTKACRSAIMFGDELTADEMGHLVKSLGKCHLPFQCAHGRPSIVPLAYLSE